MSYSIKECVLTIQGEGARFGQVAVLCRFTGCNLWSGLEADRPSATCQFCDTDFVGTDGPGGGVFPNPVLLARHIQRTWYERVRQPGIRPYVFFTGGEPLLQLDEALIDACHVIGFEVGLETNGTLRCPPGVDWVCVSPKANAPLVLREGNELKLVMPQEGMEPEDLEGLAFQHWFLLPMDGPTREQNTELCLAYCLEHPRWRLSAQLHKLWGLS